MQSLVKLLSIFRPLHYVGREKKIPGETHQKNMFVFLDRATFTTTSAKYNNSNHIGVVIN